MSLIPLAPPSAGHVAAETVPWTDIPAVQLLGTVLGTLLLIAAIRAMFGGKGRKGPR